MARISKKPDERRKELVDTALGMFLDRGYEQTTVSDIVKELGLAQGTFYYHFKSKTELLDAVVDSIASGLAGQVRQVVESDADPGVRVRQVIQSLFATVAANHQLVAFFSKDGNERLHDRVKQAITRHITPLLQQLMEDGLAQGRFDVPYPQEAAEVIMGTVSHLTQVSRTISDDLERLGRLHRTVELAILRILGIGDSKKS